MRLATIHGVRVNHVNTVPPPGKALWLRTLRRPRKGSPAAHGAERHADTATHGAPPLVTRIQDSGKDGAICGLAAGGLLIAAQAVVALASGGSVLAPFRAYASLLLGERALTESHAFVALTSGAMVHLVLSAAFGLLFGVMNAGACRRTQASVRRQLALGSLFGLALWVFNVQVIGRVLFPWLLSGSLTNGFLHVVCFGLPLGLLYASIEQRVQRVWDAYPVSASASASAR